mmetsp:Transcript_18289/g.49228  ORF Transcript_18289/g.49228 Transcript_18289/m.49228 type:complete len:170 (-) Transcript_18289:686-1195(-)
MECPSSSATSSTLLAGTDARGPMGARWCARSLECASRSRRRCACSACPCGLTSGLPSCAEALATMSKHLERSVDELLAVLHPERQDEGVHVASVQRIKDRHLHDPPSVAHSPPRPTTLSTSRLLILPQDDFCRASLGLDVLLDHSLAELLAPQGEPQVGIRDEGVDVIL